MSHTLVDQINEQEIFQSNNEMSIENIVPSMYPKKMILSNQTKNNIKGESILLDATNITNKLWVTCQENDDSYQTEYDENESDSDCSIEQQSKQYGSSGAGLSTL
ncbi:792_t:CDS:2 [Gigaspora rosea]|nr:792_t:CDS:2 [Gigaspora rosea]